MAVQNASRKRWQFTLRSFFVLLTFLAVLMAVYSYRYRRFQHAATVLKENDVSFGGIDPDELPWYDRLPWITPPPYIVSIMIWPNKDLDTIVPVLADLGTVEQIWYYSLSLHEIEMLSQIDSIESIHSSQGLTAEEIRPFMSHKLREVSVDGADCNIPEDALELLFTIPTLKRVGTAHGSAAVPNVLKIKRPDISIDITDFPP